MVLRWLLPRRRSRARACSWPTLDKWGADVIVDHAVLVVDELVTNAVKVTGTMDEREHWNELTRIEAITVRLLGLEASIRIEVRDSSPTRPALPDEAYTLDHEPRRPGAAGEVLEVIDSFP